MEQPKIITDSDVFEKVRIKWSDPAQVDVAVEELAELIQALIQHRRGRMGEAQVCEEIADVAIMVDQLISIFGKENYRRIRAMKMRRLWDRVNDDD